ncbi:bacteriophage tail protein [Ameyamaea chiangmaiensis NBRC 103196]|uniref:DUF2313 domain-containing protein n=1 Tax=Ameyamaea chiangmaiensis TaxID=442969 RepID=A0A850P8U4_9PROT|nr:putative phage tail protein [Ameyamaea chiangmaiensis]MBS4075478.1 DUF2313 domain-containing protein [Ameyamaea chiangmaiensis]NVN38990.1 DUF2313 domain-containing protein [Ameyamaea chiangmaiensis]GBQ69622.1 bacteriophage tail protein [Ameyamaea chiangmaiensis NBRC 103196]
MAYTADDYRPAILRIMPRGPIWSRAPGSLLYAVAWIWSQTWGRLDARAENLLVDAFPATSVELLTDWESTLGLPDPCAGTAPTLAARRNQVVARLADSGGCSADYFTNLAAQLGYTISITRYWPACADFACAEDPVYGEDWAFCWVISAPGYSLSYAQADVSSAGDPLMTWGNSVLQCELSERNPAHLILRFGQTGTNVINDFRGDIQ